VVHEPYLRLSFGALENMGKQSTQFSALNYIHLALDLDAIFFISQKCLESP